MQRSKDELQYHESLRPTSNVFNRRDILIDCFPTRVLKAVRISKIYHGSSAIISKSSTSCRQKAYICIDQYLRFPSSADVMYHDAENVISKQTRRCHSLSTL